MPEAMWWLVSPKLWIPLIFVGTTVYVHLRGQVRLKLNRQIVDHSTVMAPYNTLMYLFSAVPPKPFIDVAQFPELKPLAEQYQMIREEALRLFDEGYIRAAANHNDAGFNTFFRTGWKRFHLKWYDDFLPSAKQLCPRTTELLAGIPSIDAAMFALLPPGSRLGAHRDPFGGSLRYHLGLSTPNSPQCWIDVDGQRYHWKDGEAVMFDETYVHSAANETDTTRLILFCDVERPLRTRFMRWVNRTIGWGMIRTAATQNVEGEHVGVLSRLFHYVHEVNAFTRRIKSWNRPVYYGLKWLLFGGLLALIVYLLFF